MAILNYTTKVPASKTVGEIQEILASGGAKRIMIDYGSDREPVAVSFLIEVSPGNLVSFRLPSNPKGVLASLEKDKVKNEFRNMDQAQRVAWRVIKDWVEAQLAIIYAEQATMLQVFLPYAVTSSGDTMFDHVMKNPKLLT
ncbi:hypothetical protein [Rufibacter soli]